MESEDAAGLLAEEAWWGTGVCLSVCLSVDGTQRPQVINNFF